MPGLQNLIDALASKHDVPGAVVAVLQGDLIEEAATGTINTRTGVPATTDTLFRIGSVTKLYTATLAMQLVDEGSIELDVPVRRYLADFRVADPSATETITVRQLLCHTNGLDRDYTPDTGRGDGCIQLYLADCATMPQTHPPGAMFSYSNAGYTVLGGLIERVTGKTWDAALRERLLERAGLERTFTLPEEAILHRAAVGHFDGADGERPRPTAVWGWPRATGPCGGIICTAGDLLAFARLHLDGGLAPDGAAVLSREAAQQMQIPHAEVPGRSFAYACGLGWMLNRWDDHEVVGHDGNGLAQIASLRVVPELQFALAVVANSYSGNDLAADLIERLFSERLGIAVPRLPQPCESLNLDLSRYTGSYRTDFHELRIDQDGDGLLLTMSTGEDGAALGSLPSAMPLRPVDEARFLLGDGKSGSVITFIDFDASGRPRYLHNGRASRRVESGAGEGAGRG